MPYCLIAVELSIGWGYSLETFVQKGLVPSLRELLPSDFLPVYGTPLTPGSFKATRAGSVVDNWQCARDGWVVEALSASGALTTYFILVQALHSGLIDASETLATCIALPGHSHYVSSSITLNEWEHPLMHPYDKSYGTLAPVSDWVSAVMLADATGRRALAEPKWESGITDRKEFEISTASFHDFNALRSWLEAHLKSTQVGIELATIARYEFSEDGKMRAGMMLRMMRDDEPYSWVPMPVTTAARLEGWFEGKSYPQVAGNIVPEMSARVALSGTQIMSSSAKYVLSWSKLCEQAELERDEPWRNKQSSDTTFRDDWLVIHIVNTDIALAFPREFSNLEIRLDDDGSQVCFSIYPNARRSEHHRRQDKFERRWGKWLDEAETLSDKETADACALAENALRGQLESEAR